MNFLIKRIIRNVTIGAPSKCYLLMCDHQIIASIRQHSKFLSPDGILNVDKLKTTFSCDDKESEKIITFLTNMQEKQTDCLKNLEYFHAKGVSTSAILQNLHLLKIAPGRPNIQVFIANHSDRYYFFAFQTQYSSI